MAEARLQAPIGDEPALTAEQSSQNEAKAHKWHYVWNESCQSWDIENTLA